ncbi:Tyrosine-specific transport protein [Vibrio stylophorae]|uniref:Tyrosine-specific transport protein n=1 Tax=Vibrio stylophorae TaxID=659351 RepID=A0ABM8ZRU6_9VIBR|nr:aromatic amino acid transport family protein [Vibrio stylophorae]CAH0533012.1 Tyrosine-specific transport protein [Vibrio stylophorae]
MISSKTFGSTLIIAGTTIGAGMVALPIASAGLGFGTASLVMLGLWCLTSYTALLMVEAHQHAPQTATLHTLSTQFLGRYGALLATFATLFLFYALCAAYIAGSSDQLAHKLSGQWQLTPQWCAVIVTLLVGAIVSRGAQGVDWVNRILFTAKLIALVVMLSLLTPNITGGALLERPVAQGFVIASLPVIFTSFGFHGSIPSIVRYVGIEPTRLKRIFICGSALPLVVYILWQMASHGVLSQNDLMNSKSSSELVTMLSAVLTSPRVSQAVSIFIDLALATSFLGVSLGLFDFLRDRIGADNRRFGRTIAAVLTFAPPLCFALFYPKGFAMALGYAAIALAILAIFMPVALVYQARKLNCDSYQVRGGNLALIIVTLAGIAIVGSQLLQMAKLIPAVG